jgi:tight adherence protein B
MQFGIFVAVTTSALTLFLALAGLWQPGRNRIRRRLAGEFEGGTSTAPSPLYKDLDALDLGFGTDEAQAKNESAAAPAGRFSPRWRSNLEELLRQAGMSWSVRQFAGIAAGSGLILGGLGFGFLGWFAGIGGFAVGVSVAFFFLITRRKMRRERYLNQLLGAFELMARVLRAGQAVPEAFRAAVDAFEDPLKSEFEQCLHQIEHGLRPETAFRELSQRSGILELGIFVIAMTVQRQSGGNLSEVLDRLAAIVRNRLRVRQKIRTLTAEGRMQSFTLLVLPILTFFSMYFLNREYAEMLLEHTRLLAATVALVFVGVLWIRSIMNFEG